MWVPILYVSIGNMVISTKDVISLIILANYLNLDYLYFLQNKIYVSRYGTNIHTSKMFNFSK